MINCITSPVGTYVGVAASCIPASVYVTTFNVDPIDLYASTIALFIVIISSSVNFSHIVSSESTPFICGISTCFLETTM